jgi:hypothetical protein
VRDFVIKAQPRTEMFIGGHGHIVISQDKEYWEDKGEDKRWVQLRPEFVPEIIEQLQRFAEVSREAIREPDEEPDEEPDKS